MSDIICVSISVCCKIFRVMIVVRYRSRVAVIWVYGFRMHDSSLLNRAGFTEIFNSTWAPPSFVFSSKVINPPFPTGGIKINLLVTF